MPQIEITPHPAGTLSALAGGGYSPATAVADLIDNTITAKATQINLTLDITGAGTLTLTDNGQGMNRETLIEAMRVAGQYGQARHTGDLGRYGTGLKAAGLFLSSTGHFQVSSAPTAGQGNCATLNLQNMVEQEKWVINVEPCEAAQGTTLTIYAPILPKEPEAASVALKELSDHLRTTFAGHLSAGLDLRVQGHRLTAWPLCHAWPEVSTYSPRKLGHVRVTPFILPTHQDDLNIEGPGGRVAHAGLHIHRSGRAITTGGWQGIGTGKRSPVARDRIRLLVEIDPDADEEWKVTLSKSGCTIPAPMKARLRKVLEDVLDRAGRQRGVRQLGQPAGGALWITRGRIKRDHPLVMQALQSSQAPETIEALLNALEAGRGNKR